MGNPIRSKSSLTAFIYNQCCCCLTLRTGSLAIGIAQVIIGILWIVGSTTQRGTGYASFFSTLMCIVIGILIIIGVHKNTPDKLWWSVYIFVVYVIWAIIIAIVFFISLLWSSGIVVLVNAVVNFYFAMIIRSYAFELEDSATPKLPA